MRCIPKRKQQQEVFIMENKRMSTKIIALCSVLTALVVILQFMGAFVHFGLFSVSFVLIPIVLGAALCGTYAGIWLGFVFGVIVLLSGDAAAFLAINIPGTILTVLLKGIACGFFAGLVYKLTAKYNRYLAVIAAAVVCPVVNTGVFLLGCRLFFWDTILSGAQGGGFESAVQYIVFSLVGGNFLFELGLNMVISPVIVRLIKIRKGQE